MAAAVLMAPIHCCMSVTSLWYNDREVIRKGNNKHCVSLKLARNVQKGNTLSLLLRKLQKTGSAKHLTFLVP